MHQDGTKRIEECIMNIEELLSSRVNHKTFQNDIGKEFKKFKALMDEQKNLLTEEQRKSYSNKERKLKKALEKVKPTIFLTADEKTRYRDEILKVLSTIEKKVKMLQEKKDNKKRNMSLQFFKYHQSRLSTFAEWLLSPTKKFAQDIVKNLMKYITHLHVSHEDSVFKEELEEIYEKIMLAGEETDPINKELILNSYYNRPKINDYLPSRQTKENTYRNPICPNYKMIDLSVIPKMSKELLFLLFYFHKGETEQYLAAKELMKNSWRYYKRFNIWLKRVSEPDYDQNKQYESGNYYCVGVELQGKERGPIRVYHRHLIGEL